MKPGGGCQFTFTCDGSLARRPLAGGWSRARRIAAEALAGKVYRPVGHATHSHTLSIYPPWAPGPARAAVRSEERRVGKECVSACRSRGLPYHTKNTN